MRGAGRYRTGSFPPGPARPGPAAPDGRVCGGGCRGRAAVCRHDGPVPDGAARTTRLLVLRALGLGDLLAGVPALRAPRRAHPGTDSCRLPPPDSRRSRRPRGPWTGCCPPPPSPAGCPAHPRLDRPAPPRHRRRPARQRPAQPPAAPCSAPPEAATRTRPGPTARPGTRRSANAAAGVRHRRRSGRSAAAPPAGRVPGARCGRPAPRRRVTRALPSRPDCATVACGSWSPAARPRATWWPGSPRAPVCRTRTCPTTACLVRTAVRSRGRRLAVISGDTGIAHLAVAHGTRSIALSGPVAPSRWGPPARRVTDPAVGPGGRPARPPARPGQPARHRRGRPRSRRRTAPQPAAVEGSAVLSRRSTGTSAGTRRTSSGATARRTPRSHPART
ncbi:glycosyltransferase family 9 protein [Streptomyces collinus]|uniref:glycosyltransferase family 9 protein n=1 Tax=Streptomyces collinus TaxID=42684 RepID=UPI003428A3D2